MTPGGFEPAIPPNERLQTHTLDRAVTGTGQEDIYMYKNIFSLKSVDVSTEIQYLLTLYLLNIYSASMGISGRRVAFTQSNILYLLG